MTKRFTPKASDYTLRLAEVQAKIKKLKSSLAVLEEEGRSLTDFLVGFYEVGQTEVVMSGSTGLVVSYQDHVRSYLDQEKAKRLLTNLGKKIPMTKVTVTTFSVKKPK